MNRREMLSVLGAAGVGSLLYRMPALAAPTPIIARPIPRTGELLPVIGLGSWITFNVGDDPSGRDTCAEVMRRFVARGGRVIDSSPMYGSSEQTIGFGLTKLPDPKLVFSAEKVWTSSASEGKPQIKETLRRWGLKKFDLLQVHNLENWQAHLPMLLDMKRSGAVRYVGVTTSHGRRMDEVEQIMRTQPLDFVQFTYNIADRQPESRLLPLAHDHGIAVITNRPFREGALLQDLAGKPVPEWGKEFGGTSWPTFLLKFIVSHPSVNVAIPATSVPAHVEENMGVAYGALPDEATRKKMVQYFTSL
jgi:diketogulonate reductase-like aldo/keto reductase